LRLGRKALHSLTESSQRDLSVAFGPARRTPLLSSTVFLS